MEKTNPKKVFILENNGYIEISYEELCERTKLNSEYESKLFLPLHGMLMEVTENVYQEFYRDKRRQEYLDHLAEKNHVLSYDALTTDELSGEVAVLDQGMSVIDLVEQKWMKEELIRGLTQLEDEERIILKLAYFEEMTEKAIAARYGVSQQAIHKKKIKVLGKLKKFLEN